MNVLIETDLDILHEANRILLERMQPSKLARLWAMWSLNEGDYLLWRDETFGAQSVEELYEAICTYQDAHPDEG